MSWERPLYLDLFSCEGGMAKGAELAGCHVVCVDIEKQPRNPFEFVQADAFEFLLAHGHEFDIIGASPPCQFACQMFNPKQGRNDKHLNLIPATRELLQKIGKPYVIENVKLARKHLINPVKLTGSMFNLPIFRDRYFEVFPTFPYFHGAGINTPNYNFTPVPINSSYKIGNKHAPVAKMREAMGMEWASKKGLRQAIPPLYAEYIVRWLVLSLGVSHG